MTKMQSLRGFTLVEMAIVLVLFGIVMSMGLKMVTANLDNAAFSATKSKQERIKLALIGYLRTNGKLPCPNSETTPETVADGIEPSPCSATAPVGYGVIPWQALGLPREAVVDGWGNLFTYRVANFDPATTPPTLISSGSLFPPIHRINTQNWTSKIGSGAFDISSYSDATVLPGYRSLQIESGGGTVVSRTAVVVILSHGKNGFGAKTVKVAARIPATVAIGAGADEISNATSNTTIFIRRPVTEDPAAVGGAYDDLVVYMTPQDLLQPLVTEGTLKATCKAYCTVADPTISCVGYPPDHPSSPSCGSSNAPYCAAAGAACSRDTTTPTCSYGTIRCTPYNWVNCTPTTIPVGNTPATCP